MKELEDIMNSMEIQIVGFSKFVEKLNLEGILLKESKNRYKVYGIWIVLNELIKV